MLSHFSYNQLTPFLIAALLLVIAVILYQSGFKKTAIQVLFAGGIFLGFFMANLDHFLILWDEQYHALVAKNMLKNPLMPLLYDNPVLDYDYMQWTANHIWLHKQPLFLWQMMVSLKLFGIHALAVRIPSVIMHALMIFFIYRIGKIINHEATGFYGALYFTVAYYPLELLAGRYPTDHNDMAFLFYITASFWSWFEYRESGKIHWILLTGLFSGCAVLVKWLMGLLIYLIWFILIIYKLINKKKHAGQTVMVEFNAAEENSEKKSGNKKTSNDLTDSKEIVHLLLSIAVAFVVFVPWQLYIFYHFPREAVYEFTLNSRHLFEAVEGHSGDAWFHFDAFKELYGAGFLVPLIVVAGLFILIKKAGSAVFQIAVLSVLLLVYGFYSFVATKMVSYCIIVSPFIFLGIGALVNELFCRLKKIIHNKPLFFIIHTVSIMGVCILLMNISKIQKNHTMWKPLDNGNRAADLKLMSLIERLPGILKEKNYILFSSNIRLGDNIPVMFFTGITTYNFIPTREQIEKVKSASYKVAVINNGRLPDYLLTDQSILKIQE